MQWKALDNLLERIEKLEKEVELLKPIKLKENEKPRIYVLNNGKSFLLDQEGLHIKNEKYKKEGEEQILDGIKNTIDNINITNPDLLYQEKMEDYLEINIFDEETIQHLHLGIEVDNKDIKRKLEYLKQEEEFSGISIRECRDKIIEEKLSNYPLS